MELTLFLAQLIGLTYVIFAIGGLVCHRTIERAIQDFKPGSFTSLIAGLIALMVGLAVVLSHNVWDGTWRVWITILGWGSLLKGVTYIFCPDSIKKMADHFFGSKTRIRASLLAVLVLGAYLAYKGFGY